jgi:hypothetical protein
VALFVILNKRSVRGEGSGRAARSVAFLATQQSRVLARFLTKLHHYRKAAGIEFPDPAHLNFEFFFDPLS